MTRTVYVNGEYLPETEAKVSIFDRGFLMADGVYEVTSVLDGKLIDFEGHVARLDRSLSELDIAQPASRDELLEIHRELIRLNEINQGLVYLQVTRGAPGDRDFAFPDPDETPTTLVLFTQNKPNLAANPVAEKGMKVISIEDIRWGRRDIKTIQLLYPSMGKMMAKKAGVDDAWMVQDSFVTEGISKNGYIVKNGKIITRERSNDILHGITRAAVLRFAAESQMEVEERNFTIDEAKQADEAFLPLPAHLSCQWLKSTALSWAMAPRAVWRDACVKSTWKKAGNQLSDQTARGMGAASARIGLTKSLQNCDKDGQRHHCQDQCRPPRSQWLRCRRV